MSHDAGYDCMVMGCNLERADMTTRIIDVRSLNLSQPENAGTLINSDISSMICSVKKSRILATDAEVSFLLEAVSYRPLKFCL